MYDIIIIGAGPAGLTAALYALRAEKKVLVFERGAFGGQMTSSPKIENFPAIPQASGNEIADRLVDQVLGLGGDFETAEVTAVRDNGDTKTVITEGGAYTAKALIAANGVKHRLLGLEGEEELIGNGISMCAVCDGAFYKNRTVAVVGGGNSALQEALMLSDICRRVIIIQNLDRLTGEAKLCRQVEEKQNITVILNSVVTSYIVRNGLSGVCISEGGSHGVTELDVDGLFLAVGLIPENTMLEGLVELDERGYFDSSESCETKTPGIFVAGDCRKKNVRQITTAVADGAVAGLAACRYIDSLK